MKNLKLVSLVLLMLISLRSLAQEKMVTGIVSDSSGMPLPGVGVIIKGTNTGTETDFDGKYSIKVKIGQELEFSYIGMKKQTIKVGVSNVMNIVMLSVTL